MDSTTETVAAGTLGANARPPVFVVGCPRSGTTLVGQILDTHSEIAVYLETSYYLLFRPVIHLYGDLNRGGSLRRLLTDFVRSTRVQGVSGPSVETLQNAVVAPTLEGVLSAFLHVYALERGKRRGGEKTPLHFRYLPEIVEGFPDSPVIFLMRDPRDTVKSMQKAFGTDIDGAANLWSEAFDRYVESSSRVQLVRYEELVQDPVTVVHQICRSVGEPYEPAMMRFFEHIPAHLLALKHLDLSALSGPVVATSVGSYREMSRDAIQGIETICAAGMEAMGYPFAVGSSRSCAERSAERPNAVRSFIDRLRYYGLNRERWRRGWFRWSLMARLNARYVLRLERLRSGNKPQRGETEA